MTAPTCPISKRQYDPGPRNGGLTQGGLTFVTPPMPTDLASLIAAVNALRAMLLQFTGQWTVNNEFQARTPNNRKEGNTYYSQYPAWQQVSMLTMTGFVYHQDKNGVDYTQSAYVNRINKIDFQNQSQEDPDFQWSYYKPFMPPGVGGSGA